MGDAFNLAHVLALMPYFLETAQHAFLFLVLCIQSFLWAVKTVGWAVETETRERQ